MEGTSVEEATMREDFERFHDGNVEEWKRKTKNGKRIKVWEVGIETDTMTISRKCLSFPSLTVKNELLASVIRTVQWNGRLLVILWCATKNHERCLLDGCYRSLVREESSNQSLTHEHQGRLSDTQDDDCFDCMPVQGGWQRLYGGWQQAK